MSNISVDAIRMLHFDCYRDVDEVIRKSHKKDGGRDGMLIAGVYGLKSGLQCGNGECHVEMHDMKGKTRKFKAPEDDCTISNVSNKRFAPQS